MKKYFNNPVLYAMLAVLSMCALAFAFFLFFVESYNTPVLDDIIFLNQLEDMSIWEYVRYTYLHWQGRYMGFLEHGIQYRIYNLFHSTIPYSVGIYIMCIATLYDIFRMHSKFMPSVCLTLSMVSFGLFVVCLPDFSSYFWMCTKTYPVVVIFSIWWIARVYSTSRSQHAKWYEWIWIVVVACSVGCSTEVFAPMILVLLGSRLIRLLQQRKWSIRKLFTEEPIIVISFIIGAINFFAMVFSPGTFVRMEVLSDTQSLSVMDGFIEITNACISILKKVFFKLHYYVAFFIIVLFLFLQEKAQTIKIKKVGMNLLRNVVIVVGLFLLSMALSVYATGSAYVDRALAQLPASIYLLCFLFAKDFSQTKLIQSVANRKTVTIMAFVSCLFVFSNTIYSTIWAYPELRSYWDSREKRVEMLQHLETMNNKETVKLETLDGPEYHSIFDDLWRLVMPKYSRIALLRTDEVGDAVDFCYNVAFRRYYHLSFDVIADLKWVGI